MTFQLLTSLQKCHENGVYHGDIKSENVLVTSWNWVYLADFASFKPVYLPEDDPSEFSFFFDTSSRRSCYVAPERFLAPGEHKQGELQSAMDIFSLGCVIAELFMEGTHTFTLAQLFKYRKGEFTPDLSEIENPDVRELALSMISLDPSNRLSAGDYLDKWKGKLFPEYFYNFLHDFIGAVSTRNHFVSDNQALEPQSFLDQRIEFIYDHFDTVVHHLGFGQFDTQLEAVPPSNLINDEDAALLDLPGWRHVIKWNSTEDIKKDDGALIILSVISSSIRNVSRSSIKLKGLDLMLATSELINDEAKLDRCLPFILSLLDDESDLVQAAAIKTMTQLLRLVNVITPVNGAIFPEYIFQKLESINSNPSVLVRATYASCISSLAQSAQRFLELSQVLKTAGMLESIDPETENGIRTESISFDSHRQGLVSLFKDHASALLTDSHASVKKAFLKSIIPLCIFFGRQKTNDVILTHLITYLNDPDSSLRRQFFDCIIGLGPFIGPISLEQYIQPLMLQSLNDPEEYVIAKAFEAFATFAQLGLLKKSDTWNLLKVAVRYTMHPNNWIRNNVFGFLDACIQWMTPAERYCTFNPIVKNFLDCDILDFTLANLIRSFKPPLSRMVFREAMTWASHAKKSQFWKIQSIQKVGGAEAILSTSIPESFDQVPKSSEDNQYLERIYRLGTTVEDVWKIAVLREHIYRVARLSTRLQASPETIEPSTKFSISTLGLTPKTIRVHRSFLQSLGDQMDQLSLTSLDDIREFGNQTPQGPKRLEIKRAGSISTTNSVDSATNSRSEIHMGTTGATLGQPSTTTATDTTDVYGQMDQPYIPTRRTPSVSSKGNYHGGPHNEIDSDPHVASMVRTLYAQSVTTEPSDFGPQVVPITYAEVLHNPTSSVKKPNWKPAGILASQLAEHTAAVNKIAVSPDHSFFLSCSDDGYIKLWDCSRLEKNVINKSAQTFYCGETKAKFICFIENTYTFACSCSDGSVKIIRVDATFGAHKAKYKKMTVVREYRRADGTYAVWMQHIKTSDGSILIMATTDSKIIGLDMNSMKERFVFDQPYSHGVPTCFVIDTKRTCLLLGTSQGVLDLWDLRFNILVNTWTLEDPAPIRQLCLRPKDTGFSVCMLGGTNKSEISVWKINEAKCTEVYHANHHLDPTHVYQLLKYEEPALSPATLKKNGGGNHLSSLSRDTSRDADLLCMAIGVDSPKNGEDFRHIHVVSGASDRRIRFWDLNSIESNSVVSGLSTETETVSFFKSYNNSVKVVAEKTMTVTSTKALNSNGTNNSNSGKSGASSNRPSRHSRTTVIAAEQQDLAKNHLAAVVDIAILHRPYQMIVSADRTGVIKVFI